MKGLETSTFTSTPPYRGEVRKREELGNKDSSQSIKKLVIDNNSYPGMAWWLYFTRHSLYNSEKSYDSAKSRIALWVDMCDMASEMMYHACIV